MIIKRAYIRTCLDNLRWIRGLNTNQSEQGNSIHVGTNIVELYFSISCLPWNYWNNKTRAGRRLLTKITAKQYVVVQWRCLKQQNRYLSVIIVCGYFSFIRSFTCLNFPSKSNSYHNTSLSMSFGCWHLSGIPLCPLHFTVYTIAWQRKFEPQWVFNTNLCILSG